MPLLTDINSLLGEGTIARQFFEWTVLNNVAQAVMEPFLTGLRWEVWSKFPFRPLSPPQLADLVLKGWLTQEKAATSAATSGVSASDFDLMIKDTGEPPGLQTVMEWYRRGIIPWSSKPGEPSVEEAIRTSRIITKVWADTIRKGNVVPIPAAEMVDAAVEGQVARGTRAKVEDAAAGGTTEGFTPAATTFYEALWANGYTPAQADVMFNTRGRPPSPMELITLFRRGLIGWTGTGPTETTVQQGIYEGATKDKWEPIYKGLVRAIPSEYYVMQMLKNGSITAGLARKLLGQSGYTATVIAGIVSAADATAVGTDRKLAQTTVTALYFDQAISRTEAATLLHDLGYGTTTATFMLMVQDMKREMTALSSAITKVGSYYIARKIDGATATQALSDLGVPASQVTRLLQTWTTERTTNVRVLTEAQIVDAWDYRVIDQTTALAELQAIGYTAFDAWVLLSVKNKGPLGTPPARTANALTGNIT